ncbi:Iron-regulated protein FrpA [Gracilariopsis chorda]|uniref:Iron-regulated protein FrpA n=1 Tax=Gracilariopsis chorda TaxID=448386 RepID=A0A2V3IV59_9FLOR|nr:Iron-regulated protein FrpA [Gracilariopsis chorda]|eukprot:PXF45975.1 Iron-regulated protein FrpA [Gracilariopsis chorda]
MAEVDIFDVSAQAEFIRNLGRHIASEARQLGMHRDQSALNPMAIIDEIATSMTTAKVDQEYIRAVENIKEDDDIQEAIRILQDSLDGKDNIYKIADLVPTAEDSEESGGIASIITGQVSENGETDVIRLSNHLSGAGTSMGGFLMDLPQNISDMVNGITNATLFRYTKLQEQLDSVAGDLSRIIEQNEYYVRQYGVDPEIGRRMRRSFDIELSSSVANSSKKKVRASFESAQSKLLHETFLTNADLRYQTARHKGRLKAQKIFGNIGKGVQGATGGFGIALGGVDIAAGDEMIQNAERRYRNGEISRNQYDKDMRDARLRVSQGAFGIGDGLNNIRQLIVDKVGDQTKNLAKGTAMGLRFASVVGGALSIGMGVTSIAKNAIAAHEAQESGNVGRAAMYGIMAGLDCVSVTLDAVSMVLDFVPGIGTALSFVVDLANTIVGLVNMVIGFFADMVDTRTEKEILQHSFDTHVNSPEFQKYIDNQAEKYKEEGYDLFTFMIDAKALGLDESEDGTEVNDTIVRELSKKALADGKDPDLRVALVDASSVGNLVEGRRNDDKILAGAGRDTLYGHGGDDILLGQAGNDTIYGGPGNDYLNGGSSRDVLIGGTGDDFLSYEPGIDIRASGEEGIDTLEVSANFFAYDNSDNEKAIVLWSDARHRVYVNLSDQSGGLGHGGVALGALLDNVDMLSNRMHKPAFRSGSQLATRLIDVLYKKHQKTVSKEQLNCSYLWYLANGRGRDYLTDGRYLYSCPANASNENRVISRSAYDISRIDISEAEIDETGDDDQPKYMRYKSNKLEALLAFAFLTTSEVSGVEQICETPYDVDSPYPIDVNCSVIGDSKVTLIDVACGDNEYIYTGDGDTLVLFSLSESAQWQVWKYIVGGSGHNTLIINGGSRAATRPNFTSVRYQCILLDHDIDLADANRVRNKANQNVWPANGENKVDRGVFIKNMETIQFSNAPNEQNTFHTDCTNLSSGHRFILEDHRGYLRFVGTAGDDSIMVKRLTGTDNFIDAHLGRNMISFESFEPAIPLEIDIDVPPGHTSGSITGSYWLSVAVKNIQSVKGNAGTRTINGHSVEDNLLIVNGGECTVNGRGGDNTIVAMRGRHKLNSGSGQGAYELHAPLITEFVVVSVTKGRDHNITARCASGTWKGSELRIEPLSNDHREVLLTHFCFDDDGLVASDKGVLSPSPDERSIIFTPGTAFESLKSNQTETIRVRFTTRGSMVVIDESTVGNRLKFHGFSNIQELRVSVALDGDLQFLDMSRRHIFTDKHFGELYRAGITNLYSLLIDFVARFPIFQFNGTDVDNAEVSRTEVFDFLVLRLRTYALSGRIFDTFYDTQDVRQSLVIVDGGRENYICARSHKSYYTSRNGNDIFDLTKLGTGTDGDMPRTEVRTGDGNDLVVVKGSTTDNVRVTFISADRDVKQGEKTLVFHDLAPNNLTVERSHPPECVFSTADRTLVETDCEPDLMMFSANSEHIVIDDVPTYLSQRMLGNDYYYRRVYNAQYEQKLLLEDYQAEDLHLDISVEVGGLTFIMKAEDELIYTFWVGVPTATTFDARNISGLVQLEFSRGIQFPSKTLEGLELRALVMDCLRTTDRHTITGSPDFDHVVHASNVESPYTVPSGDALLYADKDGSEIYAGDGNTVIKVTASNQTVNTGRSQDSEGGHDIVYMMEGLSDLTIQFMARDDTYKVGQKFMIMDGLACDTVSFVDPSDNPLPSYVSQSQPFVMKCGDRTVAKFQCSPSFFLFRRFDEYEIVEEGAYFVQQKAKGDWRQRFALSRNMEGMLIVADADSDDIYLSVSRRYKYAEVVFRTEQIRTVVELRIDGAEYSTISSSELATRIAVYMSGGIRFRDVTVSRHELVEFLQRVLLKQDTELSGIEFHGLKSEISLEDLLATNDPFEKYKNAIEKSNQTITITNIDPPVVPPPAAVENFPRIIDNVVYPNPPFNFLRKPNKKMAIQWTNRTWYWFDYKKRRNSIYLVGVNENNRRRMYPRNGLRNLKNITKNNANRTVSFIGEKKQEGHV